MIVNNYRGIRPLVIVGASGHAREVAQLIADINAKRLQYELIGYLDDAIPIGEVIAGVPVLGSTRDLHTVATNSLFALGVGAPANKLKLGSRLLDAGLEPVTLIHPSAIIGRNVQIGSGSIVSAGCVLTCDVAIGSFVTINVACTVSHDSKIERYATLAPGVHITGSVTVGEGCDLGAGLTTVQGIEVGEWSIIGSGAVITKDLPANITAVGVPARIIKTRSSGWAAA